MIVTVTYFKTRSVFKSSMLWIYEYKIKKQMKQKDTRCRGYKSTAFWRDVYTMTLWDNKEDMRKFVMSGAHKESMKDTAKLGKTFKSITIETDKMLDWKTAKKKIHEEGRVINL